MFPPSPVNRAGRPRRTAWLLFLGAAAPLVVSLLAAMPLPGGRVPRLLVAVRAGDPSGRVPGLGPSGRFLVGNGRLVVREVDGRQHDFLASTPGAPVFVDVSDPAVSYDGRTVAFAGVTAPSGPWRLYTCDAEGRGVRPLLPEGGDHQEIDPAWLPDGRIAFAGTRFVQRAERDGLPATNLFSVFPDGSGLIRLTTDRNGAEEPTVDPRNGRLVYARWWSNRYHPPVVATDTLTTDRARAMPADPVDLWHAISIRADGDGMRLAGGWPRIRSQTMAYQPAMLPDGTLIGVTSATGSLVVEAGLPPVVTTLVAYPGGFAPPVPIAAGGVAPLALPDGRIVFSAPGPAGDLALFLVRSPGELPALLADTPELDDLDAAVLLPREAPAVLEAYLPPPVRDAPVGSRVPLDDPDWTFRFDCLNVFANGAVDSPFPDAPPIMEGLRIRFFAVLERPGAAGDSIVLVREAPVLDGGAVHEHEMPADTPMFEQLVDADGQVIRGFNGPAHVPGFNFGRFGSGTKCVGCHAGHSAMEVAKNNSLAAWTNLAPSARLTTEGVTNPGQGTRTLVDRRAKGPIDQVGCRLRGDGRDRIRLSWAFPVEVKEVILYAGTRDRAHGSDSRIRLTDITFLDADRPVHTGTIARDLDPAGTRLSVDTVRIDALDIHFRRVEGTVDYEPGGALSEVEVIGRLVDR